jgi:hypothetical protein
VLTWLLPSTRAAYILPSPLSFLPLVLFIVLLVGPLSPDQAALLVCAHLIMPFGLDTCTSLPFRTVGYKKISPMFNDPNPNVPSYKSHPASSQLATHSSSN